MPEDFGIMLRDDTTGFYFLRAAVIRFRFLLLWFVHGRSSSSRPDLCYWFPLLDGCNRIPNYSSKQCPPFSPSLIERL
jgi:hypothetical protein